ncbi:MAG: EAL domain-containing protein [Burkholderiales bacterium]|nr:EAL domain-containing protein [Burkholderiales bacterium]
MTGRILSLLADLAAPRSLAAGEVLFEMGDTGTTMFVVKSGELRIQIGDLVFETVIAGGIVGEKALLDDETQIRSATVVAAKDSEISEIDRDMLLKLLHEQPDLTLEFCKVMVRRLRKTTFLTYHDSITGLPNRFRFQELCRTALVRAQRRGTSVGLLFVDLDHFQTINESLGFALGDELLSAVAARLSETLDDMHTVARLLADGFGVLLEDLGSTHELAAVAEQILTAVARPFVIGGRAHYVTVSIGVSCYPQDGNDPDTLLRSAESATGRAQGAGGNSYQFYSPELYALAVETLHLRNGLRQAIERKQFHLGYQPRVDVASGAIKGVEVLLRWNHPEIGVVPPAKFIPIAEQAGIIDTIGDWVLREACMQMRTWLTAGLKPFRLAVNLSARQLRRADLPQRIATILKETGMDAHHLELEITESTLMEDPDRTVLLLQELRKMGVQITLDDFGIEYSSLGYLKRFPLDYMKIDQSFMRGIPGARDDVAIAKAIITLAKNIGLRVIAEGVESGKQLAFLVEQRCEEYQGYLFSRPLLAGQIESLLIAHPGG